MKRQKRYVNYLDDDTETVVSLERLPQTQPRPENTIEAQVRDGDTLQAIALRFHCTVADIKRLNKIDKDNEIFARRIIKVPVTPHSILLETLPSVHKSGQSSPKHNGNNSSSTLRNPLENDVLSEKLLVAAVSSSNGSSATSDTDSINRIILNSKVISSKYYTDDHLSEDLLESQASTSACQPLLSGLIDESIPQPRPIPGLSSSSGLDCSGSDCDMSWICLFIFILALCFAIPLVYVFYVAEHPEKFHHNSSN